MIVEKMNKCIETNDICEICQYNIRPQSPKCENCYGGHFKLDKDFEELLEAAKERDKLKGRIKELENEIVMMGDTIDNYHEELNLVDEKLKASNKQIEYMVHDSKFDDKYIELGKALEWAYKINPREMRIKDFHITYSKDADEFRVRFVGTKGYISLIDWYRNEVKNDNN